MCLLLAAFPAQAESLSRAQAMELALGQNPEVGAARAVWKTEQARALKTWALPSPELELEYEGLPGTFELGQYEKRSVGLTQRLEFPVKWWQRHRAANHFAEATRLSVYEMVRLDIGRDVQVAYDRVLADGQLLLLAEEHVQLARGFLERAQTRLAAGDVPKLDVMRAEVALGRLESRQIEAQDARVRSQAALNVLLGQEPEEPLVLSDGLTYEAMTLDLDTLYGQALRQRSDLGGATRALASTQAVRTASLVSWVPDLTLRFARETTKDPVGPSKSWRTSFVLELPVFAVFEQRGEIAEASARHAQADAERERIRLRILQEVRTTYSAFQGTGKRMVLMRDRVRPTAEAAHQMARRSYEEGKASYLDLLEAQRDLIETGMEYVETLYEYRVARNHLFHAIGQSPVLPDGESREREGRRTH
ncbi:MAG: TolC family protein [bacterium]|nr:TolC family protein [bacterium]